MKYKQTIGAVVFVAASSALYYFLTKGQDTMDKKQSKNIELVKPEPIPADVADKVFMMPHFMIKKLVAMHK